MAGSASSASVRGTRRRVSATVASRWRDATRSGDVADIVGSADVADVVDSGSVADVVDSGSVRAGVVGSGDVAGVVDSGDVRAGVVGRVTVSSWWGVIGSAHPDHGAGGRDEFADHRQAGKLAGQQQSAGGLRVGE
ncbi:hypothetical protein NUM_30940 [Actinocatenispora comari]|uniref:Uncharacterized protein n=1 Tax=Actinocatenispora comari TaxID=2807577 RepID=A0A8J4ABW8_9ACTN|nr:hypothetical protein NUM_30940 [Actinocatenispora comari]